MADSPSTCGAHAADPRRGARGRRGAYPFSERPPLVEVQDIRPAGDRHEANSCRTSSTRRARARTVVGRSGGRSPRRQRFRLYRQLQAEAVRHGRGTGNPRTNHLLPQQVDADRLKAETAALAIEATRSMVLSLVAGSLLDGDAHTAILTEHVITALVRAEEGGEAYLAIAAEGFIHPQMIALMLSAVPGISGSDWQAEPGGVRDIKPRGGQIIWSTVLPPDIQARVLDLAETIEHDRR